MPSSQLRRFFSQMANFSLKLPPLDPGVTLIPATASEPAFVKHDHGYMGQPPPFRGLSEAVQRGDQEEADEWRTRQAKRGVPRTMPLVVRFAGWSPLGWSDEHESRLQSDARFTAKWEKLIQTEVIELAVWRPTPNEEAGFKWMLQCSGRKKLLAALCDSWSGSSFDLGSYARQDFRRRSAPENLAEAERNFFEAVEDDDGDAAVDECVPRCGYKCKKISCSRCGELAQASAYRRTPAR